jgi:Protein of unknown function (DUF3048) N-terminal domain/Protein of unknown function (DUF3048) C-terminal domain
VLLLAALGAGTVFLTSGGGSRDLPSASPSAPALASATPTVSPTSSATASPTPVQTAVAPRCPLNGLPVPSLPPTGQPALIVQVENHPLARPTRNLTNADIVIEATVEGDVTRFSAVFYCQPTIGLTGPVRSARYYSIDFWQEMHGLTVAFGASTGAQKRFAAAGFPQINGLFGNWPYFRRYGSAPAPHNLYVDLQAVRKATTTTSAAVAQARAAGTLRPPFQVDPAVVPPAGRSVSKVTIKTNSYWTFAWTWDAALGAWRRSDGGTADTDAATGRPITATSVVVQRITESIVYNDPDPAGNPRRDLHLVGSGTGTLYVNGQAIPVRWSRPSASAVTSWTYADGSPMVLPAGTIWWELVPVTGTVRDS